MELRDVSGLAKETGFYASIPAAPDGQAQSSNVISAAVEGRRQQSTRSLSEREAQS
jgi:hypothetical protein